jgi:hypothetical protein
MSVDPKFEGINANQRYDKLMAQAEAQRAAKAAGTKSFFRRLRERLRPPRQEPNGGNNPGERLPW